MSDKSTLSVDRLQVRLPIHGEMTPVVDDVTFDIRSGETVGLVGESGSGKSMTAMSVMQLVDQIGGAVAGSVKFHGRELLQVPAREMAAIRGNRISMIFQEPMSSLNPAFTIGDQIMGVIRRHTGSGHREARQQAIQALRDVEIPDAPERLRSYPHELSGGMRQRAMIAMAIACDPEVLIADEPTTALDTTVQAQILNLLSRLQMEHGMSILFITHDFSVVADICDRVVVMYAGTVVETAGVLDVFEEPRHPYTAGLLAATPDHEMDAELATIPGVIPLPTAMPTGCRFHPRCTYRDMDRCTDAEPSLDILAGDRCVRCLRHDEIMLRGR